MHEKIVISLTSGHKRKHVEHKSPMDLSFQKMEGLPIKESPKIPSRSEDYQCPILEEKLEDVDTIYNPK